MKKLLFILLSVFILTSCSREDLTLIDTEVIEGKISHIRITGNKSWQTSIYVQTPTETVHVFVPTSFATKYRVDDDFVVVIKKYKENNQNK